MLLEQPRLGSWRVVRHAMSCQPDGSRICCRRLGGQNVCFAGHTLLAVSRFGFAVAVSGSFGNAVHCRVSACCLLSWISS